MASVPPARTPEPQSLDEILDWHEGVLEACVAQQASGRRAVRQGGTVSPRFLGLTEQELDAYFDSQRKELDRLTVLNLVASVEATIRLDYFRRVRGKLKDRLAKTYRKWHKSLSKRKQDRPDLDEAGILDVLKEADVLDKHLIGRYRDCLKARHWVGHGRYWTRPTEVDRLLPAEVYARGLALLEPLVRIM